MKKIILFISILLCPIVANATSYNTAVGNDIGYNACLNFQDGLVNAQKDGYFGYCKEARCTTGEWTHKYIKGNPLRCANGNTNYYIQVINDGCDKGVCTPTATPKYCSEVIYYDCTKTRSGETYVAPTAPTSTTTTTTTTKPTTKKTTSRNTTKRTTTTTTTTTTTKTLETNNYLKSLTISQGKLDFKKDTLIYNIEVDKEIKDIDVNAVAESPKSKVEIRNNKNIKEDNPIEIVVTSENNATRIYKIYIKYKNEEPKASANNNLKSIEIENYKIKFSSKVKNYTLKVDKGTEKLNIVATPEDEKAKVQITGNDKISNKSKVNIVVTAEDGSENIYTITVKEKSNLLLQLLIILLAIIIIIFGINVARKVLPGRKDKNYDYE